MRHFKLISSLTQDVPGSQVNLYLAAIETRFSMLPHTNQEFPSTLPDDSGEMYRPEPATPDIYIHPIVPGDTEIVLACDGIWDVLSTTEVAALASGEDTEKAAEALVTLAASKGSQDNMSVLVIKVAGECKKNTTVV